MTGKVWISLIAAIAVAAGFFAGYSTRPPDRLVFLSVGQGDCVVIQSQGRTVLVDAAPVTPHFDAGKSIVLPKLRQLGIDRVDLILLSHPDIDHVGGTGAICAAFPDAKVAMSAQFRQDPEMARHLNVWKMAPSKIAWMGPESQGRIGDLNVRISCPPLRPRSEANDGSMFIRVGQGQAEAVLTGDAPEKVEDAEMVNGDWSAEILKAGHHGSRTATGLPWLRSVHPRWVVISCGKANRYGHPNREALDRIKQVGAATARTDTEGDVSFEWKGENIVRTF